MQSVCSSPGIGTELMIGLIRLYQVHMSPYKGFACAYRRLHGGRSCSAHAKHILERFGPRPLIPLMLRRRDDCRNAAAVLSVMDREALDEQKERRRRRFEDFCCGDVVPGDLFCCFGDLICCGLAD